jgi:hypothetical protein
MKMEDNYREVWNRFHIEPVPLYHTLNYLSNEVFDCAYGQTGGLGMDCIALSWLNPATKKAFC